MSLPEIIAVHEWVAQPDHHAMKRERQGAFLDAISQFPGITRACHAVGVSPRTFYGSWVKDAAFKYAFDIAVQMGKDKFEELQRERAEKGWDEPKFGSKVVDFRKVGGRKIPIVETTVVGSIHRFSERLAERFLEADSPEKFARKPQTEVSVNVEIITAKLAEGRRRAAESHDALPTQPALGPATP